MSRVLILHNLARHALLTLTLFMVVKFVSGRNLIAYQEVGFLVNILMLWYSDESSSIDSVPHLVSN